MTRIAVIDDHKIVADGLELRAQADGRFSIVYGANVAELLSLDDETVASIDVVLLDLRLYDGSSVSGNVEALRQRGMTKIYAFSSGDDPYLLREAVRAGIDVLIPKSSGLDELHEYLTRIDLGAEPLSFEFAAAIDSDLLFDTSPLSPRQVETLTLYAKGMPLKSVARRIGVSENTADDYIRTVKKRYIASGREAGTKTELYQRGVEDGFIQAPGPRRLP